mmetsp:Transcript_25715/g.46418  ORF Transcript_25715/g.46418 Transcript_25715/m.46418 type:complete len:89 (+) Transcript_25715:224-490(+)
MIHEQVKVNKTDAVDIDQDQSDMETNHENAPNILGLLGNMLVFFLLFMFVAEGTYYWNYSKPAYSLFDLHHGLGKMLNAAIDNCRIVN